MMDPLLTTRVSMGDASDDDEVDTMSLAVAGSSSEEM